MQVTINFKVELTPEQIESVLQAKKFGDWVKKVATNFDLDHITVTDVDFFGSKVGFVKARAAVKDMNGNKLPGIAFIRGDAVSILFIIKEKETGNRFIALVGQGRVPVGEALIYESPAGMMDEDNHIAGVAIKELEEELGLSELDYTKLKFLTEGYTSPGGQDEKLTLYSYEHEMSSEELFQLEGKITGEVNSREVIKVKVIPFNEFLRFNSTIVGQLGYLTFVANEKHIIETQEALKDL